jgi:hypothetical protein
MLVIPCLLEFNPGQNAGGIAFLQQGGDHSWDRERLPGEMCALKISASGENCKPWDQILHNFNMMPCLQGQLCRIALRYRTSPGTVRNRAYCRCMHELVDLGHSMMLVVVGLCQDETRTSEHIGISPAEEGWNVASDNEIYLVAALTCNVLQQEQHMHIVKSEEEEANRKLPHPRGHGPWPPACRAG